MDGAWTVDDASGVGWYPELSNLPIPSSPFLSIPASFVSVGRGRGCRRSVFRRLRGSSSWVPLFCWCFVGCSRVAWLVSFVLVAFSLWATPWDPGSFLYSEK